MPKVKKAKFEDQLERVHMPNRASWREWLQTNHKTFSGVWLIYNKARTGQVSISYDDAVKEALCFGWIDSKVKSIDDKQFMQIFTPRKPKSVWSKLNKTRIEELMTQNLMTEAGLNAINIAKDNGSWESLDDVENLIIPKDLQDALDENETAKKNFEAFPRSKKKTILYWISSVKKVETRASRIEKTITSLEENKLPNG